MAKKQVQEEQAPEAEFRSGGHMFANTPYEYEGGEQAVASEEDDSEDSEE